MTASKIRQTAQVGKSPDERFFTITADGEIQDPGLAIAPIIRQHPDKKTFDLIGTGFFVAKGGIFITARHVLEAVREVHPNGEFGLGLIQQIQGNAFVERPIIRMILNNSVDIGIGICAPMSSPSRGELDNPIVRLSTRDPEIGEHVFTYAYPDTIIEAAGNKSAVYLNPHFYEGRIVDHFPIKRDSAVLTWPCFQTSMHLHGGSSGGPVFDSSGAVFGINTTSLQPDTNISYVTKVRDALGLFIGDLRIGSDTDPGSYSIYELALRGFASVAGVG